MRTIKKNSIGNVVPYTVLSLILLVIGWDIGHNMCFFDIDNPSVLVGSRDIEALLASMMQNIRVDFMYNIIVFFSANILGNTPTVHFMVQFLFYIITIIMALHFLKSYVDERIIAVVCVSSLVWGSPLAENLYTIGKKEIFMTTGMAVCIVCLYKLVCEEQNKRQRVGIYVTYIAALIFAMTLKETSIILILPIVLLFFYVCMFQRKNVRKTIGSCFGLFAVVVLRQVYKKMFISAGNYTDWVFTLNTIEDNIWFYLKYHFDICFLAGVGLVSSIILFFKDVKNEKYAYLLIINLTGWGYVGGICLWRWNFSYYLYPAILFFALSSVSFFVLVRRKVVYVIFGFLGVLFALYGGNYNYRVARSHKDASIIYTDSIYSLDNIVENGGRIIIDDSDMYTEPPHQMRNLLIGYLENDVDIYGGAENIWNTDVTEDMLDLYGYTRERYEVEKEAATLKKGDYLVHYIHDRNYYGRVRAINPAATLDTPAYLEEQGYVLKLLDEQLLSSKYFGWSDEGIGVHDMQTGYQIYRLMSQTYRMTGIMSDGWSGQKIIIENYQKGTNCNIIVSDIGTAVNHWDSNSIEILIDGESIEQIEVVRGSIIDLEQYLSAESKNEHTIELIVKRIFVPAECNPRFNDTRELGVNIQLEQGDYEKMK